MRSPFDVGQRYIFILGGGNGQLQLMTVVEDDPHFPAIKIANFRGDESWLFRDHVVMAVIMTDEMVDEMNQEDAPAEADAAYASQN